MKASILFLLGAAPAWAGFLPLFEIGTNDRSANEFGRERGGFQEAPGSATERDDHYYLKGSYGGAIGTLTEDEPVENFERALTSNDERIVIHFNLSSEQATNTGILRVAMDFIWSGMNDDGQVENQVSLSVNGRAASFTSRSFVDYEVIHAQFPTEGLDLVAGANSLEIRRTGVTEGSWVAIDQVVASLHPTGNLDDDDDQLPLWWEEAYHLSDGNRADAGGDLDGDELTNLEEFLKGTNPRLADTDADGLSDSDETVSDPRNPDSDGDGLLDGEEVNSNPLLVDTDTDGASDAWEISTGYDPNDDSETPPAWAGAIGINFRSTEDDEKGIWPTGFPNGVVPQINWNQTVPLRNYGVESGEPLLTGGNAEIEGGIINASGATTGMTVTFTYDGAQSTDGYRTAADGIFNGYLANDTTFPATLTVSQIPAAIQTYDLYVYLATNYVGPLATIRKDGDFTKDVLVRPMSVGGELDFIPYRASTGPSAPLANYVVYRGLTEREFSLESFRTDGTSGIAGIQIVDVETDSDDDGIPDSWELRYRSDVTADADPDDDGLEWLAEFEAGSDPWKADTDGDDLSDSAEVAAGTDANHADTDRDGLSDFDELNHPLKSNPLTAQSDGNGLDDIAEREQYADPLDDDFGNLPVPTYPAPGQVLWEMTDLQFVKDHGDAIESDSGTNRDFIDWRVENFTVSRSTALRLRIPRRGRKMVFNVSTGAGASFTRNGNNFGRSDYETDLTRAMGFVGFGNCDTSDPLTFRMLATNGGGENNWTVVFSIFNQRTNLTIASLSIEECSAAESVANQTAMWGKEEPEEGEEEEEARSRLILAEGIRLFRTKTPIEQLPGFEGCADADNDGMTDAWETLHGLNPNDPSDADLDSDGDQLTNVVEAILGSSPKDDDSDNDGVSDLFEADQFTDPNSEYSFPPLFSSLPAMSNDINGNGMSDLWESRYGVTGLSPDGDADGDGFTNLAEAGLGTDPFDAGSNFTLQTVNGITPGSMSLVYPRLHHKNQTLHSGSTLNDFAPSDLAVSTGAGRYSVNVPLSLSREFFRVKVTDRDLDGDGLSDWDESVFGSSLSTGNSLARAVPHDSTGDGIPDEEIDGDAAVFLERFANRPTLAAGNGASAPTRIDAARLLMQGTFGPTMKEINEVREMGIEGWIDDQINRKPVTHHEDYIREIMADLNGPRVDLTYRFNGDESEVEDSNLQSAFARAAISGPDQLRQRVAFALSQILVISRQDGALDRNVQALARYYDRFVDHAFGNYHDILMEVTLDANMGRYLSHVGNRPPAPEINRFPDENYAREVMQLFSIGLWELNQDGTRKLDTEGNPIQTYDNDQITELARVMTGLWFGNERWGQQTRHDTEHLIPMVMFPDYHDFGEKTLLNGFVIPAREPSAENGMQDIRDAIRHLFEHPNCAPFITRSLIQFLVTSNPSPGYVKRIADIFDDNGSGVRGDLGAVVKAILMDPEARDPAVATSPSFGLFREPLIRTMHLARLTNLNRSGDLVWWDYGSYFDNVLQMPLNSTTVFNFYRPDYTPPGVLEAAGLDGPAFEITNSYTAVSFPNVLWDVADEGFEINNRYAFSPDYGKMMPYVDDPDILLDYLNLVVCGGGMSAEIRTILKQSLAEVAVADPVERVKLAVYLTIMSPAGAVQK